MDNESWYKLIINACINGSKILLNNLDIENKCVIFDIDGTIITEDNRPIILIIKLYNYALALGYKCFIITARPYTDANLNYTVNQLINCDIKQCEKLYMMPLNSNIPRYKFNCRKDIFDSGYSCVLSIGDNIFDIGLYGGLGILLPKLK